ncbi:MULTISPECIES: hypothetical protein [Thalassospira]|jgi:hypothetical protein|uniref:Uncharacterized protein n=1 Tax=Thalassospira marina TaxID=2048283 RepID=A0A2N3KIM5_9PROT|nr:MULTISPECIES: hypothetical protein [Thalassospira]OSQ38666.1 hypothetical protein THS27_21960 [Thalassospira sp. MCCC 1A01428]PKR50370.1 hypothetical protein COO20_21035 [Thalassospira marina]|tara:strand:+ start:2781 stop:3236 length:456 start_codon:yes stop_codon:yes gene_type:complete
MTIPTLVCGFLSHADQTVAERIVIPTAQDWPTAVRRVARSFAGEMMFVVALRDDKSRKPSGVWEELPIEKRKWSARILSESHEFTVIGFNNLRMEPLMLHVTAPNWIVAAHLSIAEKNHEGFRFVACFEGHIPQADVLGSARHVDADFGAI